MSTTRVPPGFENCFKCEHPKNGSSKKSECVHIHLRTSGAKSSSHEWIAGAFSPQMNETATLWMGCMSTSIQISCTAKTTNRARQRGRSGILSNRKKVVEFVKRDGSSGCRSPVALGSGGWRRERPCDKWHSRRFNGQGWWGDVFSHEIKRATAFLRPWKRRNEEV